MRSPILLSHHPFRLGETLSKASLSVSQSPLGLSFMPMNSVPTELCWGSTWSPRGERLPCPGPVSLGPQVGPANAAHQTCIPPPPNLEPAWFPAEIQKREVCCPLLKGLGWIPFHCCHLFPLRCVSPAPPRVLAPKMFYSRISFWSLLPWTAAHLKTPGGPTCPFSAQAQPGPVCSKKPEKFTRRGRHFREGSQMRWD